MDPINLLLAINLFVSISANWSGAKKGLKISLSKVVNRPKTYLQKTPPNISALILLIVILGIFNIGALPLKFPSEFQLYRIIGLGIFIVFSWMQIVSFKTLGGFYAQELVIMKDHKIIRKGFYKFIRHPQYVSQILSDLGAGIALMNFIIVPLVLFVELPLFVLRAIEEEKMMRKHFGVEFEEYKKKSGFMIPFIG